MREGSVKLVGESASKHDTKVEHGGYRRVAKLRSSCIRNQISREQG